MDIEEKSGDTHGAPRPSRLPPTTALEASRLRDTLDTTLLLDSTTPLLRQHTPTTEHVAPRPNTLRRATRRLSTCDRAVSNAIAPQHLELLDIRAFTALMPC